MQCEMFCIIQCIQWGMESESKSVSVNVNESLHTTTEGGAGKNKGGQSVLLLFHWAQECQFQKWVAHPATENFWWPGSNLGGPDKISEIPSLNNILHLNSH